MATLAALTPYLPRAIDLEAEPVTERTTEFELECERLRLKNASVLRLINSQALRYWAMRHAKRRYVPEFLLTAWGIHVEPALVD